MAHPLPQDFINETQGMMEGIADWAYTVTQGSFWSVLLAVFCVILGIATVRYGSERAIGFGSLTGLLGALFLATLGLMPWWIASIFIIVGAVGFTYMIMNK